MPKKIIPPLTIEQIQGPENFVFLSTIEYKKKTYLIIVDNIMNDEISAFVIDKAGSEMVDLNWFLGEALRWYYSSSQQHPLSFEFSRLGLTEEVAPIMRSFRLDHVSRLIGHPFSYDFDRKPKLKHKKVSKLPEYVQIRLRRG